MRASIGILVLILVGFAFGAWDILVRQAEGGWVHNAVFPLLLIAVLAGLYWRARKENED